MAEKNAIRNARVVSKRCLGALGVSLGVGSVLALPPAALALLAASAAGLHLVDLFKKNKEELDQLSTAEEILLALFKKLDRLESRTVAPRGDLEVLESALSEGKMPAEEDLSDSQETRKLCLLIRLVQGQNKEQKLSFEEFRTQLSGLSNLCNEVAAHERAEQERFESLGQSVGEGIDFLADFIRQANQAQDSRGARILEEIEETRDLLKRIEENWNDPVRPNLFIHALGEFDSETKPSISDLHFNRRWLPYDPDVHGTTLRELDGFIDDPRTVLWWALVGEGGAGKSRLAHEYCLQLDADGWYAGFFDEEDMVGFLSKAEEWRPRCDTAIIIDYARLDHRPVQRFLATLRRKKDLNRKIRVLLLNRPDGFRTAQEADPKTRDNIRETLFRPYVWVVRAKREEKENLRARVEGSGLSGSERVILGDDETLRLPPLNDREILKKIRDSLDRMGLDSGAVIASVSAPALAHLVRITDGRLLLVETTAIVLSRRWRAKPKAMNLSLKHEELLLDIIEEEIRRYWIRRLEGGVENDQFFRQPLRFFQAVLIGAAAATFFRGLKCPEEWKTAFEIAKDHVPIPRENDLTPAENENYDKIRFDAFQKAVCAVFSAPYSGEQVPQVQPLKPDLLGEFFVLILAKVKGWNLERQCFVFSDDRESCLLPFDKSIPSFMSKTGRPLVNWCRLLVRDFREGFELEEIANVITDTLNKVPSPPDDVCLAGGLAVTLLGYSVGERDETAAGVIFNELENYFNRQPIRAIRALSFVHGVGFPCGSKEGKQFVGLGPRRAREIFIRWAKVYSAEERVVRRSVGFLSNAIFGYGRAGKEHIEEMGTCVELLKTVHCKAVTARWPSVEKIAVEFADGLVNAVSGYSNGGSEWFDEMAACVEALKVLKDEGVGSGWSCVGQIALAWAKGIGNASFGYGDAGREYFYRVVACFEALEGMESEAAAAGWSSVGEIALVRATVLYHAVQSFAEAGPEYFDQMAACVEDLEALNQEAVKSGWSSVSEIALARAKGLANLSLGYGKGGPEYFDRIAACVGALEVLKQEAVEAGWSSVSEIALARAKGLNWAVSGYLGCDKVDPEYFGRMAGCLEGLEVLKQEAGIFSWPSVGEIALERANGLLQAVFGYGEAGPEYFDQMTACLDQLQALMREATRANWDSVGEIALTWAKGLVCAVDGYGKAGLEYFERMTVCLAELGALTGKAASAVWSTRSEIAENLVDVFHRSVLRILFLKGFREGCATLKRFTASCDEQSNKFDDVTLPWERTPLFVSEYFPIMSSVRFKYIPGEVGDEDVIEFEVGSSSLLSKLRYVLENVAADDDAESSFHEYSSMLLPQLPQEISDGSSFLIRVSPEQADRLWRFFQKADQ